MAPDASLAAAVASAFRATADLTGRLTRPRCNDGADYSTSRRERVGQCGLHIGSKADIGMSAICLMAAACIGRGFTASAETSGSRIAIADIMSYQHGRLSLTI